VRDGVAVLAFAVLLGLIVGSFLNVVIWRVPRGESVVRPPSHCPGCDSQITPRDNVPIVSWLALRGRCRQCRAPISIRYPAVEALTAATFGVVAWRVGARWELPAFLYLAAVLIALAFIDYDTHRLPNALTLPSYLVGITLLVPAAILDGEPQRLLQAAIGMAALYGLYFVLAIVKQGGMGFGDVKLAGVIGLYLGFLGWGPLLVGGFLGFLFGGIGGALAIAARRAGLKSKIPFGPYMVLGTMVAICAGVELAHLYTGAVLG
jgi:leader peptidase (prepilin peptidase)/N-methyltransferase